MVLVPVVCGATFPEACTQIPGRKQLSKNFPPRRVLGESMEVRAWMREGETASPGIYARPLRALCSRTVGGCRVGRWDRFAWDVCSPPEGLVGGWVAGGWEVGGMR